jgi:predicted component of type VI protein secretion system
MDAHRTASVSRVYAPNEYSVWLSPDDRSRYEGVEDEVIDELCAYLLEHARREELILASHPVIDFHTDERLALGEFGIQARLVRAAGQSEEEPRRPEQLQEHGQTMIYSTSARVGGPVQAVRARRPVSPLLVVGGRHLHLPPEGGTIGRSRDCDIVLDDVGISRRHAEIRPGADGWTVRDLGSTNGVLVNGQEALGVQPLQPGDRVELGSTEIVFEVG